MRSSLPISLVAAVGILLSGCGPEAPTTPTEAQQTYGATVDAANALPVPAVVAEVDRYIGRRVSVDGRVGRVTRDGCTLSLEAGDGPPFLVIAPRVDASSCAWQVPDTTEGFAIADTLRLSANGVQVTPVHVAEPDS